MQRRFTDRVAWVTGASSGIGEALARGLAGEGATVVLSARRQVELERVRATCPEPDRVRLLPVDLLDGEARLAAATAAQAAFGRIDVLVLAAGVSQRALALEAELASVRRLFELDFFAAIDLARLVVPGMVARGYGRVVVVSSVVGHVPTPGRSAYAAAKHALHGWFDALRAEIHGTGVRVTLLCPGYVRTQISHHALRADGSPQGVLDRQIARGMEPEDLARRALPAIARGRREAWIGGWEVAAIPLRRWLPGLVAWRLPHNRPH
ncbi:MAG: SDR family NAD(P)-dependent oxidoreductase [Deltaproteobacteria bacterium]|nr:SDR family NAD(P)-dependent oxidoreductase [Deltaproteobacteria bacterium]